MSSLRFIILVSCCCVSLFSSSFACFFRTRSYYESYDSSFGTFTDYTDFGNDNYYHYSYNDYGYNYDYGHNHYRSARDERTPASSCRLGGVSKCNQPETIVNVLTLCAKERGLRDALTTSEPSDVARALVHFHDSLCLDTDDQYRVALVDCVVKSLAKCECEREFVASVLPDVLVPRLCSFKHPPDAKTHENLVSMFNVSRIRLQIGPFGSLHVRGNGPDLFNADGRFDYLLSQCAAIVDVKVDHQIDQYGSGDIDMNVYFTMLDAAWATMLSCLKKSLTTSFLFDALTNQHKEALLMAVRLVSIPIGVQVDEKYLQLDKSVVSDYFLAKERSHVLNKKPAMTKLSMFGALHHMSTANTDKVTTCSSRAVSISEFTIFETDFIAITVGDLHTASDRHDYSAFVTSVTVNIREHVFARSQGSSTESDSMADADGNPQQHILTLDTPAARWHYRANNVHSINGSISSTPREITSKYFEIIDNWLTAGRFTLNFYLIDTEIVFQNHGNVSIAVTINIPTVLLPGAWGAMVIGCIANEHPQHVFVHVARAAIQCASICSQDCNRGLVASVKDACVHDCIALVDAGMSNEQIMAVLASIYGQQQLACTK